MRMPMHCTHVCACLYTTYTLRTWLCAAAFLSQHAGQLQSGAIARQEKRSFAPATIATATSTVATAVATTVATTVAFAEHHAAASCQRRPQARTHARTHAHMHTRTHARTHPHTCLWSPLVLTEGLMRFEKMIVFFRRY